MPRSVVLEGVVRPFSREARRRRYAALPGPKDFADRLRTLPEEYREWAASVIWFQSQSFPPPFRGSPEEWKAFRREYMSDLCAEYDHLNESFLVRELERIGVKSVATRNR
jgi:hypothetical protein